MAVASVEDVEKSLRRPLTDQEQEYVPTLLEHAQLLLLGRLPGLLERVEADQQYEAIVALVEAEAVARVLRAPDGGVYRSETDGGYSYSLNQNVASGVLSITKKEWALLGASGWKTIIPENDGYVRSRRDRHDPALRWQYEFGVDDLLSERL